MWRNSKKPLAKILHYPTNWDQVVDPSTDYEFLSKLHVPTDKEEATTCWDASCLYTKLEVLVNLKEENMIEQSQIGNSKISLSCYKLTNYFPDKKARMEKSILSPS